MPSTPVVVLNSTLTDIADAIRGKNGSSDTYKPSEMPAAITAIPSGGSFIGIPREVSDQGVFRLHRSNFTWSLPNEATSIAPYTMWYAFNGNSSGNSAAITSINFNNVATVGAYGFYYAAVACGSLSSVSASNITDVGERAFDHAFSRCSALATAIFSNVISVSSFGFCGVFEKCTSLSSVSFNNMSSLDRSALSLAFTGCTSLTSVSFPALTSSSFGSYTNQFNNMLSGVTGCTVHFPAAIQSTIGSWADVTNGFGGTNTTVLFDL